MEVKKEATYAFGSEFSKSSLNFLAALALSDLAKD
jgi:hypothetical protein